jgi:hypothetical protein
MIYWRDSTLPGNIVVLLGNETVGESRYDLPEREIQLQYGRKGV